MAWVTERKNTLSGLFYLLSALAYLRFDAEGPAGERRSWGQYGLAFGSFVLALLSKSVTCSLPAALILMMLWQRKRLTVRRLAPLIPFFAVGLVLGLNTAMLERDHVLAVGPDFDFSLADRLLIASRALLFYPAKILWPPPLTFVYPRWLIDDSQLTAYWSVAAVAIIAVGLLFAYRRGWRGPPLSLAFFAGTVFPALGFLNIYPMIFSFVADHFQYLGSLGVIACVVGGAGWCFARRASSAPIAVVLLPILAWLTFVESQEYRSPQTLWTATIRDNADAWLAHTNLAPILLQQSEELRAAGRTEESTTLARSALEHAEAAFRSKPTHPPVLSNLSEARRLCGDSAGAVEALRTAIGLVPTDANYRWQLGRLLETESRLYEAAGAYREAVDLKPESVLFRASLAHVLVQRSDVASAEIEVDAIARLIDSGSASPLGIAEMLFLQRLAKSLQARHATESAARVQTYADHVAGLIQSGGSPHTAR